MDNVTKTFAARLSELIDARGLMQKELAEQAQTTAATISRYLSASNKPEIDIVTKIAKATNVSVDYLFGLTDMPQPKESLGPELNLLLRCYSRSDARDKKTIWTILERYMSDVEKENPLSSSFSEDKKERVG